MHDLFCCKILSQNIVSWQLRANNRNIYHFIKFSVESYFPLIFTTDLKKNHCLIASGYAPSPDISNFLSQIFSPKSSIQFSGDFWPKIDRLLRLSQMPTERTRGGANEINETPRWSFAKRPEGRVVTTKTAPQQKINTLQRRTHRAAGEQQSGGGPKRFRCGTNSCSNVDMRSKFDWGNEEKANVKVGWSWREESREWTLAIG